MSVSSGGLVEKNSSVSGFSTYIDGLVALSKMMPLSCFVRT